MAPAPNWSRVRMPKSILVGTLTRPMRHLRCRVSGAPARRALCQAILQDLLFDLRLRQLRSVRFELLIANHQVVKGSQKNQCIDVRVNAIATRVTFSTPSEPEVDPLTLLS